MHKHLPDQQDDQRTRMLPLVAERLAKYLIIVLIGLLPSISCLIIFIFSSCRHLNFHLERPSLSPGVMAKSR